MEKSMSVMGFTQGMKRAAWAAALLGVVSLSAQEPPRAIPVDEPGAVVPPKAVPVTEPTSAPAPQVPLAGPGQDLYDYATLCYTQKDYQIAIKPYSDYVRSFPQGANVAEAWFRLGECYLKTGQIENARMSYSEVLSRHPRSESAASAAYRLGALVYDSLDFVRAATYFEIAAKRTTAPEVRLASLYNAGLCYKQAGQKQKAFTAFQTVAEVKDANPNREKALSEVAASLLENGKKEDALSAFSEIASLTKDEKVLGDALLKSALILNEIGETDGALKNFKRVLESPGLSADQRGLAVFGLIQASYAKGEYDTVISTYNYNASVITTPELQPKLLLLVGNAYKQRQDYRQAIEVFLLLEKNYPTAPEALEAGYQKLLSFYQLNDKDMPQFTENFEKRYQGSHPGHEYLRMSRLIRADWWFAKGDYQKATEAFSGIDMTQVPDKVRAGVLYKKGFAESESSKWNDAINTLSVYLTDYPKDSNVPIALAQRGISYKSTRAFDKALADFATIIKSYPDHSAVEMGYYQSGLIKGETRDFVGMVADLELLVKKFPNSAAAPEAWFRIGKGYIDTKQKENYEKALAPLRKAISLKREEYLDKASQLLIACQWLREDVDGLSKEVDTYLETRKDASVSPKALMFLGVNYYNRRDYRNSARYLQMASTPDQPTATEAVIWDYLGMAELESGNYEAAIKAFDNYLAQSTEGSSKVKAMLNKSRACLALGKFVEADAVVNEGLQIAKEGDLHAMLQVLQGDICYEHGEAFAKAGDNDAAFAEWKKAAASYVVVSQFYVHPEISPEALYKAALALEKINETQKAENLRKQLSSKYPNYTPKA